MLVSDLLTFQGYHVIEAGCGMEAVALARGERPDVILLDIQLPDIPGTEVARRLKADPQTRTIPIAAVTAFAMRGDDRRILESGCDAYISKPVNLNRLLELVERLARQAVDS